MHCAWVNRTGMGCLSVCTQGRACEGSSGISVPSEWKRNAVREAGGEERQDISGP